MSAVSTALVIGGGIGGLTAAAALRQQGIAVDLVELQPEWTVYGVGIIQPNNTLRALARIGVAEACVEHGFAFPSWRICDPQDNLLIEDPSSNAADPRYPPVNGIRRIALHNILLDAATKSGAKLMLGRTAQIESNGPDNVEVRFSDGGGGNYDIVVGCDGVNSATRRALFPNAGQPRFTGQAVFRYTLPRPAEIDRGYMFFGPTSKAGLVPMSSDLMYMLLNTHGDDRILAPETLADEMRARLTEYDGTIGRFREHIVDPAAVVYRPMTSTILSEPWWKGRAILIGDAAHAPTPHLAQGAAMAIEDAVLLAELLGAGADVEDVFGSFMSRRFQRAKYIVDSSAQIGAWELEEWAGIHNPDARPGELFNEGNAAMMQDY